MLRETTADGRTIEDVASVQKSVLSFLAAMARDRGKLNIDEAVTDYLGEGWTQASPEQESRILVRHLMSMTSGLNERLEYMHPAGTVWAYMNRPYSMLVPVLAKATDMDIDQLTYAWLTSRVVMRESRWETRKWVRSQHAANPVGFMTSARDLARFGLLVLAGGTWNGQSLLKNPLYLHEALQPSQDLKKSYGLLWWRIGPGSAIAHRRPAA